MPHFPLKSIHLKYLKHYCFSTVADTSGNIGGGGSARGLIRFICPSHGRGIQGMLPQENFEIYNP